MAVKITDKLVKDLTAPGRGNSITYDTKIGGFGVRVTHKGTKSFVLNYHVKRRERRITIGQYPAWTVAAAREQAKQIRRAVDVGEDPMEERHHYRSVPTVKDLAQKYLSEHAVKKRPSSARNDAAILRNHVLPKIGKRLVADVDYSDIDRIHREMKDTPYQANRVVALLSKMFNLSIRWKLRRDSPTKGIEKYTEHKRERYLSFEELKRLTAAVDGLKNKQSANALRLLILTGARKSEVLNATWAQFDLNQGRWIKPSSHTKQNRTHIVPLNEAALQLLKKMKPTSASDYLFPGPAGAPQQDIKKSWKIVCGVAQLDAPCRLHDLRHTFASILASSGLSLPIIGQLLGHTQTQTTARYAHLFEDPLREASNQVGKLVAEATEANN